jgi:hypothetical protein
MTPAPFMLIPSTVLESVALTTVQVEKVPDPPEIEGDAVAPSPKTLFCDVYVNTPGARTVIVKVEVVEVAKLASPE